MLVKQMIQMVE